MEKRDRETFIKNFGIKYTEGLVPGKNPVWFISQGCRLEGNVFTPSHFDPTKKYPAIITCNPAGAVKEHSAGLYSEKLKEYGFILLAFDNRSWGESEGFPRYTEDPFIKVEDNKNAATFLSCLDCVDSNRIAILGLCSGAGYAAYTAAFDVRFQSVATVAGIFDFAGWIVSSSAIPFEEMLLKSANARKKYYQTGKAEYVDGWFGETPFAATSEDWKKRNQLWNELSQYYREGGDRGWYKPTAGDHRSAQCIDNRYMMNVNPMLKFLKNRKMLSIREGLNFTGPLSDEAISYMNSGCGELYTVEGASHTDLYHVEQHVNKAVAKLAGFFRQTIN